MRGWDHKTSMTGRLAMAAAVAFACVPVGGWRPVWAESSRVQGPGVRGQVGGVRPSQLPGQAAGDEPRLTRLAEPGWPQPDLLEQTSKTRPKHRAGKATSKPARAVRPTLAAESQPTTQPAAASQPAAPPVNEPIVGPRQRLARIAPERRTLDEHALLTTADFVLALGRADGARAAALVDAVGYQPLPLEGELPEKPDKPWLPAVLEKQLAARRPVEVERLTADDFTVLTRDGVRTRFAAVATWMLPEDRAVVCWPPATQRVAGWVQREACLVVRVRASRATIVGGSLLELLGGAP